MTRLLEIRSARGLTQVELSALVAKKTGRPLDRTTLSRWERGLRPARRAGDAERLASALGLPFEEIFGNSDQGEGMEPARIGDRVLAQVGLGDQRA